MHAYAFVLWSLIANIVFIYVYFLPFFVLWCCLIRNTTQFMAWHWTICGNLLFSNYNMKRVIYIFFRFLVIRVTPACVLRKFQMFCRCYIFWCIYLSKLFFVSNLDLLRQQLDFRRIKRHELYCKKPSMSAFWCVVVRAHLNFLFQVVSVYWSQLSPINRYKSQLSLFVFLWLWPLNNYAHNSAFSKNMQLPVDEYS